ncbi:MAG: ADP-ribosylglycohydrolase family protein [Selenomonas sp.]|nr:ADP-ribosylglycohydrolase family protein [Selenomonas sp.]
MNGITREDYIKEFANRAKGAMYGVAVGDALGTPLEFMDALEIKDAHGPEPVREMLGGGWLHLPPGMTTDDTDMTLAVAEGLMATPRDGSLAELIDQIGQRFIAWHHSRPKDIGITCRATIEAAERHLAGGMRPSEAWPKAAVEYDKASGHRSAGNGALMRTVPIGVALAPGEAKTTAQATAMMTHWDKKQTELVADYTMAVSKLVRGMNDFMEFVRLAEEYPQPKHLAPTGYSLDSFNCALWAIRTSEDFEDAVARAVNLGGDADTIGAITGGLMGAYDGFEAIPERWVNALPAYITARLDAFVGWAVREEEKEWDRKNP